MKKEKTNKNLIKSSHHKLKYDEIEEIDFDDDIGKMLETEASQNENPTKELFSEKLVKARTDLSASQISKISRVYFMARLLKMPELATLMNEFITLRISKDRKSRAEFVEGLKANLDKSLMNNMPLGNVRQQFGK